ncbi:nucleoside triphosphate pyrophosphohydrolase [Xylanivirga thermophila]|uniref:nucleoside triphosphate pyrophosphohydrolase n=1 Tax=Xylanivirga thermophila TaxID=2496273 RepID=UPI0013EA1684|nr:nucleoside triphosphate pyrophosphohydrolase [Xylanivirga thermophila]
MSKNRKEVIMRYNITIIGLGYEVSHLTLGAVDKLSQAKCVVLRTKNHSAVPFLRKKGIDFYTLDDIYDRYDNFDEVYAAMVEYIKDLAVKNEEVVLAVPGHPLIGERLVFELLNDREVDVDIVPGITNAAQLVAAISQPSLDGYNVLSADDFDEHCINVRRPSIIFNIWNNLLAGDIKLSLLKFYPPHLMVYITYQDGEGKLKILERKLHELDLFKEYDHTSCIYIPKVGQEAIERFDLWHLVEIVDKLRSPGGCPWDREQTHESLKQCFIEETYEVLEAIDKADDDKLVEELGDVLLQVMFHTQIAKEQGRFDIIDVTTGVCKKMIGRHPHIFGDVYVKDADEVVTNWEAIKKREKEFTTHTQVLRDIPNNLPALMRSYKVQKKAALVGFDWDDIKDAFAKIDEELDELKEAYKQGQQNDIEAELGDILFAVVNVARFLKVQPEIALSSTVEKFINRFEYMEMHAKRSLDEMTLDEMDELWNEAKSLF